MSHDNINIAKKKGHVVKPVGEIPQTDFLLEQALTSYLFPSILSTCGVRDVGFFMAPFYVFLTMFVDDDISTEGLRESDVSQFDRPIWW